MGWTIKFTAKADKQLRKMDKGTQKLILNWIEKNLVDCSDPRAKGKGLTSNRSGEWRYRIGSYRIICELQDEQLIILTLEIGHRRDVYN